MSEPTPARAVCLNCPFYFAVEDEVNPCGECRAEPPRLPPTQAHVEQGRREVHSPGHLQRGWWPLVFGWEYCGRHPGFRRTAPPQ